MKSFIRKAIWCLPLSGVLFTVSILLRGKVYDPIAQPAEFLQFATAPSFQLGSTLNVFNFIILFAGVIALGLYVIEQTKRSLAKIALVLLFIAHCLTFCYLGLLAFVFNKAAMLAKNGNSEVLSLFDMSKNTAIIPVVIADTLTYILGTLFLVFAMIKGKVFPAWVNVTFLISFFLVGVIPPATLTVNPDIARVSEIAGNILIIVSGFAMARKVSPAEAPAS
jgi:hypothetical protein